MLSSGAPIHRSQQSPNNGRVSERWEKIMGEIHSPAGRIQASAFSMESRRSPPIAGALKSKRALRALI